MPVFDYHHSVLFPENSPIFTNAVVWDINPRSNLYASDIGLKMG